MPIVLPHQHPVLVGVVVAVIKWKAAGERVGWTASKNCASRRPKTTVTTTSCTSDCKTYDETPFLAPNWINFSVVSQSQQWWHWQRCQRANRSQAFIPKITFPFSILDAVEGGCSGGVVAAAHCCYCSSLVASCPMLCCGGAPKRRGASGMVAVVQNGVGPG